MGDDQRERGVEKTSRLDYSVLFQGLRPRSKASLDAALAAAKMGNVGGVIAVRLQDGRPPEVIWSTANIRPLKELFDL